MAILDMQQMEAPRERDGHGGSDVSLLLCASEVSVTLCL
jgi:hypothetical protein